MKSQQRPQLTTRSKKKRKGHGGRDVVNGEGGEILKGGRRLTFLPYFFPLVGSLPSFFLAGNAPLCSSDGLLEILEKIEPRSGGGRSGKGYSRLAMSEFILGGPYENRFSRFFYLSCRNEWETKHPHSAIISRVPSHLPRFIN